MRVLLVEDDHAIVRALSELLSGEGFEVTVEATPPLAVQYDGEVTGSTTPFTARMLPEAARFVVSEECLKLYDEESAEPLRLDD